jgi:hypothetical protein
MSHCSRIVPIRRLGASIAFQSGQIATTRGSATVSLQIGSTAAGVDGRPATLDAPRSSARTRWLPRRSEAQLIRDRPLTARGASE